jgi:hypothetical protein
MPVIVVQSGLVVGWESHARNCVLSPESGGKFNKLRMVNLSYFQFPDLTPILVYQSDVRGEDEVGTGGVR